MERREGKKGRDRMDEEKRQRESKTGLKQVIIKKDD